MAENGETRYERSPGIRNSIDLSNWTKRNQNDLPTDPNYPDSRSNRWSLYSCDEQHAFSDRIRGNSMCAS